MGEKRNTYGLLMGEPEGKRQLERSRSRWVDKIKVDLVKLGWGGVAWTGLVWLGISTFGELL
jgi:hypothetical protein